MTTPAHAATAPSPASSKLIRSVGLWGLTAMVFNGLIGAGIFGLPASLANTAGGWAPVIIIAVGLAMLPIVLVMSRLAGLFDGTGGPIEYVEAAFGKTAAFQVGWMQLLSTLAAVAANVNLLADYAIRGWNGGSAGPLTQSAIVLAALLLIFLVNLNRTSGVARALSILSVVKLAPLILLVILALPMMAADDVGAQAATQWAPGKAALLSAYAYVGFEGALTMAGEARDPKRDFPRALAIVFVGVGAIYALLIWAYLVTAYVPGVPDKAPLSSAAMVLIGGGGAVLLAATAAISIFGNATNNVLFLSRRLVAMEALGGLPAWFGRVSSGTAVPRNAVIIIMLVLALLSLTGGFVALAILSVASRLNVYLGCIAALPVVERRADRSGSFIGNAVIAGAAITCVLLIAGSELASWLAMAAAALIGAIVFIATRAYRRRTGNRPALTPDQ